MTQDELATHFQAKRRTLVRKMSHLYPNLDEETSDMLYADCWARIVSSLDVLRVQHLSGFLETVFRNHIKNYFRSRETSVDLFDRCIGLSTQSVPPDEEGEYAVYDIPDTRTDESLAREAIHQRVEAVMSGIPRTLAIVGKWLYIDGISIDAIASRLNLHPRTVDRHLYQFRRLFKERYEYLLKMEAEPL